jgi:hypothetical protein
MSGFRTFTPEEIYATDGIKPRDVEAISEQLRFKKPYLMLQRDRILQFAKEAKSQRLTIQQLIQQLQPEPASTSPNHPEGQVPSTSALETAVGSTLAGLAEQLQTLDRTLTHQVEKPAAHAIANRVLAVPGNVAIEASNIVAESLENRPVSFGEALTAIFHFRLPALRQTPELRGLGASTTASLPQSHS